MARNFLPYPSSPYNGVYSSKAFDTSRGQPKGLMIGLDILWPSYTANGNALGNANPNFAVSVNLNGSGPNSVSQLWTLQSVYIDNENVNFPVYVYFIDTLFTVSCPANSAGWYQVFTNARAVLIAGVGISDLDIINAARTRVFLTDATMTPSLDQENQSAVELMLASPAITLGSGGGGIGAIGVTASGSCYASGALSITGGGGSGATAHGVLDQYGRFSSVVIDNPGQGYTGFPVIKPTGAQNAIAAWAFVQYSAGAIVNYAGVLWQANSNIYFGAYVAGAFYNAGDIASYNGTAYQATVSGTTGATPTQSSNWVAISLAPGQFARWSNTGIVDNAASSFNSALLPITGGGSITAASNYGAAALGDQARNYIDAPAAVGVFRDNLFGTPFGSGYIYLTSIYVAQLSSGVTANWQLEDGDGDVLFSFQSSTFDGTLLDLQRCNIKLPATADWRLRVTGTTGPLTISHAFAWTYAQI